MAEHEGSWREWFARHGPAALLFARQLTGSTADAEDAVQEGFVRFWRHRERARDPVALLFASVRSAAIDGRRRSRRRVDRELRIARERPAMVMPEGRDEGRSVAIEQALGGLPEAQREVVVLRIWAGLTLAQVAETLKESPNTVASRYRYALEKLGEVLRMEVRDG